MTEGVGWYHGLNEHDFEQTTGDSEGQGSCRELDTTSVQFSSVAQSCLTLCSSMDCSMDIPHGFPVHHQLPELVQTHVHWVSDAIQPAHPLSFPFLPSSIFPSIRVFSNESVLHIRRPKHWSFNFSISPSNEHPGLISFKMD